jgi:hypothetical protein
MLLNKMQPLILKKKKKLRQCSTHNGRSSYALALRRTTRQILFRELSFYKILAQLVYEDKPYPVVHFQNSTQFAHRCWWISQQRLREPGPPRRPNTGAPGVWATEPPFCSSSSSRARHTTSAARRVHARLKKRWRRYDIFSAGGCCRKIQK